MNENKKGFSIRRILESRIFNQLMPIGLLVILIVIFQAATGGRFATPASLQIIVESALIVATVATGAAFIFATGNVSLSMGATTVLTATFAGMAYNATESLWVMIITALGIGVVIMAISAPVSYTHLASP